jgi:hypothetical protein
MGLRNFRRAIRDQSRIAALLLYMGSEARCSVRNDTCCDHEAVTLPCHLLYWVGAAVFPSPFFGVLIRPIPEDCVPRCGLRSLVSPERNSMRGAISSRFLLYCAATELGPSRYFQDVLQDSSIVVAGKLSAQSQFP